jgi:hypothetical protein
MATRRTLRFGGVLAVVVATTGALLAGASPALAKGQPEPGCSTEFTYQYVAGVGLEAYNYEVCSESGGGYVRYNGNAYIENGDGVLISGENSSGVYIGNSGPGYADYTCNGTTEREFYVYGPGEYITIPCG